MRKLKVMGFVANIKSYLVFVSSFLYAMEELWISEIKGKQGVNDFKAPTL